MAEEYVKMHKDKWMEAYRRKYWDIKNLFPKFALRFFQLPSPDEVGSRGSSPEQLQRKLQELDCFVWAVMDEFERQKEEMAEILRSPHDQLRSRQDLMHEDPPGPTYEKGDGANAGTGEEEEFPEGTEPNQNDHQDNQEEGQGQDQEDEQEQEQDEQDHEKSLEELYDYAHQGAPSRMTAESWDAKEKLIRNCSAPELDSTYGGSFLDNHDESESEDPDIFEMNRGMKKLNSDGRIKAAASVIASSESGEADQRKSSGPKELERFSFAGTMAEYIHRELDVGSAAAAAIETFMPRLLPQKFRVSLLPKTHESLTVSLYPGSARGSQGMAAALDVGSPLEQPIKSAAASSERKNGDDGVNLVKTSGFLISESKKDGNVLNEGKGIASMDVDSDELDPSELSTESITKKNLVRNYSVPVVDSTSGGSVQDNNREESESEDQEIAERKLKIRSEIKKLQLKWGMKKFVDDITSSESGEGDRRKSTPGKGLERSSIVNTVSESVLSSALEQPAKSAAVSSERHNGEDGLKTLGLPISKSNGDGNVENFLKDGDSDELGHTSESDVPLPRRKSLTTPSLELLFGSDCESDSCGEDKYEEVVQENPSTENGLSKNDTRTGYLPSGFRISDNSSSCFSICSKFCSDISSGDEDISKGKSRRVARKKRKRSINGSDVDLSEESQESAAVNDDEDADQDDGQDDDQTGHSEDQADNSNDQADNSEDEADSSEEEADNSGDESVNSDDQADNSGDQSVTANSDDRLGYPKKRKHSPSTSSSSSSEPSSSEVSAPNSPKEIQFTKRGRKNIRPVLTKADLSLETQKAEREERNRKRRCDNRNAQLKLFSRQSLENDSAVHSGDFENELVLERDSRTKAPVVFVDPSIAKSLKLHQSDGVLFMWNNCFETIRRYRKAGEEGSGCVLAHCMGLGKTLQSIALIHTVMTCPLLKIKTVLVICPLTLAYNWCDEFDKWLKDADEKIAVKKLFELRDKGPSHRKEALKSWKKNGGIAIIHYNLFRSLIESADESPDADEQYILDCLLDPGPELVICDEGHLLKNCYTKTSKFLNRIRTKRRIILTGTPLQNNLMEYHSMIQFVKPDLLGSSEEFRRNFQDPIENGQHSDSNADDVTLMKKRTHILHKLLESSVNRRDYSVLVPFLPEKQEYTLLIRMSPLQRNLYNLYWKLVGGAEGRLLLHFSVLGRIWSHPYNLSETTRNRQNSREEATQKTLAKDGLDLKWWSEKMPNPVKDILQSPKFIILMDIVKRCAIDGDKLLVFSQSHASLDLVEHYLETLDAEGGQRVTGIGDVNPRWRKNKEYFRIDGLTPIEQRKSACDELNAPDSKVKLMLLSTKAGCLGINLVGANRVVVFDASWNPSNDMQAIFRAFRFGQKKPCYIYRFIAKDTMEEKVYNKQVVKLSLAGRVVDDYQINRHFLKEEVNNLYDPIPEGSETPLKRLGLTKKRGVVPKDNVLAEVLLASETGDWISSFYEHDSLLESCDAEMLTEEQNNTAWEEYNSKEVRFNYQSPNGSGDASSGSGNSDDDTDG